MKALLICPAERPTVRWLAEAGPLVTEPLLGQGLIEYWLTHLAGAGIKQVLVLAHSRPEEIHALVGNGARWGLSVQVSAEPRELSPAEALLKHADPFRLKAGKDAVTVLNHFPGQAKHLLFHSYAGWFAALLQWMPQALTPDRVGVRQVQPGIWVGMQSRISPAARLVPPCWIGKNVSVAAGAVIGPSAIVEDGAFVESGAQVVQSYAGPDTYVGRFMEISHSLALGSSLINWQTGSATTVPDSFLLCALRRRSWPAAGRRAKWLADLLSGGRAESSVFWSDLMINKGGAE